MNVVKHFNQWLIVRSAGLLPMLYTPRVLAKELGVPARTRLVLEKVVKTIEDVKLWIEHQVAPSLFVLATTIGCQELFQIVGEASARLSRHQKGLIQTYAQMLGAMAERST